MIEYESPYVILKIFELIDIPTQTYACQVRFEWPLSGCHATICGTIRRTANWNDYNDWDGSSFVEVPEFTAAAFADTPEWWPEWEMPIHFTGKGKTDIIDIVHAASIEDKLEFDALVYPLRPKE
jgi:hypothetical protein|nr:MAG TPA: hypothetical protein [Caudoviricetes sp.]